MMAGTALLSLLAVSPLAGCSTGTSFLLRIFANPDVVVPTSPGDGNPDDLPPLTPENWFDVFRTPAGNTPMGLGIASASLLGTDPLGAPIVYPLLEVDPTGPLVIRPPVTANENQAITFANNSDDLPQGTYTQLVMDVVFMELAVQVENGSGTDTRRLRVYFKDYTETLPDTADLSVCENDLLMNDSTTFTPPPPGSYDQKQDERLNGQELSWILRATGGFTTVRAACPAAGGVYQSDPAQFPDYPDFTWTLTGDDIIVVTRDTAKNFSITLQLDIMDLFFFDDTENDGDDLTNLPGEEEFDALDPASNDGKIDAAPTAPADFQLAGPGHTTVIVLKE